MAPFCLGVRREKWAWCRFYRWKSKPEGAHLFIHSGKINWAPAVSQLPSQKQEALWWARQPLPPGWVSKGGGQQERVDRQADDNPSTRGSIFHWNMNFFFKFWGFRYLENKVIWNNLTIVMFYAKYFVSNFQRFSWILTRYAEGGCVECKYLKYYHYLQLA